MKKDPNLHLCEKWLHVLGSDGGTSQMLEFHCKTWGPRPASLRLLFNIHLSVLVWLVWEEIMMRGNSLHWLLVTFKISLKSWLLLLWHYEVRPPHLLHPYLQTGSVCLQIEVFLWRHVPVWKLRWAECTAITVACQSGLFHKLLFALVNRGILQ